MCFRNIFFASVVLLMAQLAFSQGRIDLNVSQDISRLEAKDLDVQNLPAHLSITAFVLHNTIKQNNLNIGDEVMLNMFNFEGKKAKVTYKHTDVNKVTSYILKFDELKFSQVFISVNTKEYLINIDLPEVNRKFVTIVSNKRDDYYLIELDLENEDHIECKNDAFNLNEEDQLFKSIPKAKKHKETKTNKPTPNNGVETYSQPDFSTNSSCACNGLDENDPADLKVLIVYTQASLSFAGSQAAMDNLIAQAIARANNASINSNLGMNFILAHSELTTYVEASSSDGGSSTDLSRLRNTSDGFMDNVHSLRNTHAADFVHLVSNVTDTGGIAYTLNIKDGRQESAFALTRVQQLASDTFIHELGHNMGANHSKGQNAQPGPTNWLLGWDENTWSAGWRFLGNNNIYYCDLMTYTASQFWNDGNGATRISYFSSPLINFEGQPIGDAVDGDNARTLKTVKQQVSKYRDEKTLQLCAAGADNPSNDNLWIKNVTLADLNNSSSWSAFSDFSFKRACLHKQTPYTISIDTEGTNLSMELLIWVDWNNDKDFDDTGELVFQSPVGANTSYTATITPPLSAITGNVRMRIRYNFQGVGSNSTPCGNSGFGEVEDYTISVKDAGYVYEDNCWSPIHPSGISTLADDINVINGSTALTSNTAGKDLIIFSGASLSVPNTLQLDGDINNNGLLSFTSNASSTGQLDTFNGSVSGTGTAEVQRYIPARRAFRFLSSAVTTPGSINANWQEGVNNTGIVHSTDNLNPNEHFGTHITGSQTGQNGFDATASGNNSMFGFNNTTQSWQAVNNTNVNTLQAGKPYRLMVRGDRSVNLESNASLPTPTTLRARGQLHTGSFSLTSAEVSNTIAGFNHFGNPYQAALNMTAVRANSTNIYEFMHVFDPTLGGTLANGGYVTVDISGGVDNGSNNDASSSANQYLQPGQAAFLRTATTAPTSINVLESHKAVNQPQTAVFSTLPSIRLQLYDAASLADGSTSLDGIRIRFSDTYSNEVNHQDAQKPANQNENLAALNGTDLLSIESRNWPTVGEEIPLFINGYQDSNYVLKIHLNEVGGVQTYLFDQYLNTYVELTNNETLIHEFSIDAGIPASSDMLRFSLLFENETLGINDFDEVGFSIYPNPTQQGKFSIQTKGLYGEKVVVNIYNMLGQRVFSERFNTIDENEIQINAGHLSTGMYNVKLIQDQKTFVEKLIVK